MGQYSSLPRSSLWNHTGNNDSILWTQILRKDSLIFCVKSNIFSQYLRPFTCPIKIPAVMKIEVPIPIAPRSAVGAISPKYWGWTQMATPVKIKHEFNYIYQDNITLIIKMYFWIIYPHLFQWKNVQWWVIQIILLGNSDPSAEQPLMQICYWSAVPLSWKNIGLQLEIMKNNIELGFFLNGFFCPHLPSFTDNVPPIVAPMNPPTVNIDTIVDQSRVRISSDMSVW